jgi:hypothetical protein
VYADVGPPDRPGSQLAALAEAIFAGRHDAGFATHPMVIGDLDQIEALDRLCRQHGARLRFRWSGQAKDPRALYDVISGVKRFTVTDEHLRLLRRAYVGWDEIEFGAPEINAKRPYGNSNVYGDIAEILGLVDGAWQDDVEEDWPPPELEWRFLRLQWRPRSRCRSPWPLAVRGRERAQHLEARRGAKSLEHVRDQAKTLSTPADTWRHYTGRNECAPILCPGNPWHSAHDHREPDKHTPRSARLARDGQWARVSVRSTLHLVPHGGVERLDGFQKACSRGLPLLLAARVGLP